VSIVAEAFKALLKNGSEQKIFISPKQQQKAITLWKVTKIQSMTQ